jgi:hypothetical protein
VASDLVREEPGAAFIPKPFSRSGLMRRVREILSTPDCSAAA